ncbi:MAG: hypothetical protein HONBIEJF_02795 [Fimbriimonadaceae bacterium]|nr:hypothetical protein [Fimbriimonadaceae bacterium]
MKRLLASNTKRWEIQAAAVADSSTQLIFRMLLGSAGAELELSDVLEKAKRRAGNDIIKKSGERFSPFYTESFDRIIRDENEYEERLAELLDLTEDDDDVYVAPDAGLQQSQP